MIQLYCCVDFTSRLWCSQIGISKALGRLKLQFLVPIQCFTLCTLQPEITALCICFLQFSLIPVQPLHLYKSLWNLQNRPCKVCTISCERPVNYLCNAWHVFPPKYEAWTHFNRPWTEYHYQRVVHIIITRLSTVNLLCFSDSREGIDFLNCTLNCPATLKLANQNRYFY